MHNTDDVAAWMPPSANDEDLPIEEELSIDWEELVQARAPAHASTPTYGVGAPPRGASAPAPQSAWAKALPSIVQNPMVMNHIPGRDQEGSEAPSGGRSSIAADPLPRRRRRDRDRSDTDPDDDRQ